MKKLGCIIIVAIVVGILTVIVSGPCRRYSTEMQAVQNTEAFNKELVAFLEKYDPPLSSKRQEIRRAIQDNQVIRNKLHAKIKKYPSEEAKEIFRTKVVRYDEVIWRLNHLLAAIDKNAQVAMARRDARIEEGGGIGSKDSQQLIDSAKGILKQAAALQNDSEDFSSDSSVATPRA